jgi:hypothetical protein
MRTVALTIPRSQRPAEAEEARKKYVVPAETMFAPHDESVTIFERVQAEHAAAFDEAELRRRAVGDAIAADRAELAAAHLAGRAKKPTDTKVQAARAELEASERTEEALAIAVRDAARRVQAQLDENRAAWTDQAREALEGERAGYAAAVEALVAARESWRDATAMVAWLEAGGSYNPAMYAPQWPSSQSDLEIEAGLREPQPRTLREHVSANRREREAVGAPAGDAA